MESQATGHLMMQFGLGGEYFLTSWLPLGADLGYTASLRKFKLGNATLSTDVQPEDNPISARRRSSMHEQRLTYLAEARSYNDVTYRDMELSFDGWRMLFQLICTSDGSPHRYREFHSARRAAGGRRVCADRRRVRGWTHCCSGAGGCR